MIDTIMKGHNNQLTREACECLLTRGMHSHGKGMYSFSRDNRIKVSYSIKICISYAMYHHKFLYFFF